jgi:hypothetical protein
VLSSLEAAGDGALEPGLVLVVRGALSAQPGDVGFESGPADDALVAGGKRFDFGVGEFLIGGDVVEGAGMEVAAEDLVYEPGLELARLPSPNFRATRTIECNAESRDASVQAASHACRRSSANPTPATFGAVRHASAAEIEPLRLSVVVPWRRLEFDARRKEPSFAADSPEQVRTAARCCKRG